MSRRCVHLLSTTSRIHTSSPASSSCRYYATAKQPAKIPVRAPPARVPQSLAQTTSSTTKPGLKTTSKQTGKHVSLPATKPAIKPVVNSTSLSQTTPRLPPTPIKPILSRPVLKPTPTQPRTPAPKKSSSAPAPSQTTNTLNKTSGSGKVTVASLKSSLMGSLQPDPSVTDSTEKKQLEDLEKVEQMIMSSQMSLAPTIDPYGQKMQTLDVRIPIYLDDFRHIYGFSNQLRAIRANASNVMSNFVSMYRLAKANAFPDVDIKSKWSRELFRWGSISGSAWVASLRVQCLSSYIRMNQAIAAGDIKTVKQFTTAGQQEDALKIVRTQDPGRVYQYTFHGERMPCRVVSLRAIEGYMGTQDPKWGNRMFVHALVRFDTMQSLWTYPRPQRAGATPPKPPSGTEPKRVVEYMVMEKRMWYDGPWVVREQVYEGVEPKLKSINESS